MKGINKTKVSEGAISVNNPEYQAVIDVIDKVVEQYRAVNPPLVFIPRQRSPNMTCSMLLLIGLMLSLVLYFIVGTSFWIALKYLNPFLFFSIVNGLITGFTFTIDEEKDWKGTDKITDSDLLILSRLPGVKNWLIDEVHKRGCVTYSSLWNARLQLMNVHIEKEKVHEKSRILALIKE
jgi:hypothetical protein